MTTTSDLIQKLPLTDTMNQETKPPPDPNWPNTITSVDIKPTCVRIINAESQEQSIMLYDAEVYEGMNDRDNHPLTMSQPEYSKIHMNIAEISTFINLHQQQNDTQQIFDINDLPTHAHTHTVLQMRVQTDRKQMDSGANKNVTDNKSIIKNYTTIKPIPVFGIEKDEIACEIIGKGVTELETMDGTDLKVIMYYSPSCSGTILSPNAIVRDSKQFTGWNQVSHLDTGKANMLFFHRSNFEANKTIEMTLRNDLWFIAQPYLPMVAKANRTKMCLLHDYDKLHTIHINKLNKNTEYEIWHQRLMHPGKHVLNDIHNCTIGIPKLTRHKLHSCHICNEMNPMKSSNKQMQPAPINRFGDRFQMDYGFMAHRNDKRVMRSHDGYNCYLLIIESFTRYLWVFLSKNKAPPIRTIQQFFRTYGNKEGLRIVRTDQGGELSKSQLFRETLQNYGYSVEITGADNSSQNAIAERPHRTLANMVRAGLENAGLAYRFWRDALLHAVYIKNRLPHQAFQNKMTPYEKLTGNKPDLTKLRIFGSRIVTRKTGKRSPKITKHSYSGIFLRYAKTIRNIVYFDTKTKKIKTTTYAKFDEAHFSYEDKPPGAKILIELGLTEQPSAISHDPTTSSIPSLNIIKRHPDAVIPTQGSKHAAGFDLYSIQDITIPPNHVGIVDTGISTIFPPQTYGRIASRSGLSAKHSIEVGGGVIDPDYTGNIKVILYNFGSTSFDIKPKDRIAQLIIEKYLAPPITVSTNLPKSERAEKGFGSTGLHSVPNPPSPATSIPYNNDELDEIKITRINTLRSKLHANELEMCFSAPVFTTTVEVKKHAKYPTLGLQIKNSDTGPIITTCTHGSPSSKISQWRSILKNSRIHSINDELISNDSNIANIIKQSSGPYIQLQVIPPEPTNVHPDTGLPQLNFDQFLQIATVHQHILQDSISIDVHEKNDDLTHIVVNKLA